MTKRLTIFIIALLASAAAAGPARAQDVPALDLFVGYNYLRDSTFNEAYPSGWSVGASKPLNRWLSITGEYAENHRTFENVVGDLRFDVRTGLAGGRVSARFKRVTEFGQLLAGVIHVSSDVLGSRSAAARLAVQGGVGLDYAMTRWTAARLQLDFRRSASSSDSSARQVRVLTAIVFMVP